MIEFCERSGLIIPLPTVSSSSPKPVNLSLQNRDIFKLDSVLVHKDLISLNLSCNPISSIDSLTIPENLESLDLSYTALETAPNNLVQDVKRLSLRGNSIKELGTFNGLANLTHLDISYMGEERELQIHQVTLKDNFWSNVGKLTIVISPGMKFTVPQSVQDRVTFVNAQNNERVQIVNGQVECKAADLIPFSSASKTHKSTRSNPWITGFKWLAIPMLALISYLGWKLWTRARA